MIEIGGVPMRTNAKNTRRATAITLTTALVVAVYLNWQYARTGSELEVEAVNVLPVYPKR